MAAPAEVSIYESIGGEPALVAVVDDFYVRVLDDPQLAQQIKTTISTMNPSGIVTMAGWLNGIGARVGSSP